MRGLVLTGNRQLEVREYPKPTAGPGQIVLKMKVAAICGSDIRRFRNPPNPDEIMYTTGHEPCGIVEEVGIGVTHVKPGQRVAIYHYIGCNECSICAAGLPQHCAKGRGLGHPYSDGSDADYLVVEAMYVVPLPDELSFIDGVFAACIAGTSYHALKAFELSSMTNLCIFGLGPVGMVAVRLAKAMGPRKIICVDPNPARRQMALDIGADLVLDSDDETVEKILEYTNGGAQLVLETSGSIIAQKMTVQCASIFGKIVVIGIVGCYDVEGGVNLSDLILKGLTVVGSYVISLSEFYDLLDFMVDKDIHFEDLVTDRFDLDQAEEAFRLFDEGGAVGKVIFEFD